MAAIKDFAIGLVGRRSDGRCHDDSPAKGSCEPRSFPHCPPMRSSIQLGILKNIPKPRILTIALQRLSFQARWIGLQRQVWMFLFGMSVRPVTLRTL